MSLIQISSLLGCTFMIIIFHDVTIIVTLFFSARTNLNKRNDELIVQIVKLRRTCNYRLVCRPKFNLRL